MEISAKKVKEWLDQGKAFSFLDVRRIEEREICSLGGVHIPLNELQDRFNELDPNQRPWVIYCHHGVRSLYATQFLKLHGYDALSLRGGVEEWATTIDPNLARY